MIHLQYTLLLFLLYTFSFSPMVIAQDAEANSYSVQVTAGAFDRTDVIVSFLLPDQFKDGIYLMQSEGDSNDSVYLQIMDNKGRFILENLSAGATESYTLAAEPLSGEAGYEQVTNEMDSNSIKFQSNGNDVLSYFYEESEVPGDLNPRFKRAGYIHPVYTPGGVRVIQHFNPDRPHQYGIWSAWHDTEFQDRTVDFWGAQLDDGRIDAEALDDTWEGPVYGGFRARHRFVDYSVSEPVTALNEQWEVFVYQTPRDGNYHIFDIHMTQTANTGSPVEVLTHEAGYGGISIRGHDQWNGEGLMNYLSSEGYNRTEVVGKRIRWSHMGGSISGRLAGIALLDHPANLKHPHGVFINDTEPFFSYGPLPFGNLSIEPGSPWSTRYRLVVHDGEPDPEELDRLWNDYAYPPAVAVTKNED